MNSLGIAVEEADETVAGIGTGGDQVTLRAEAQELLAILARSYRTARENTGGGE